MMAATPAGILHPTAAVRPPAISFLHHSEAARPSTISFFRQPSRRAHLQAVIPARPASPLLRCASSSPTAVDDEEEYYVVLPPWAPSKKEMEEMLSIDLSPAAIRKRFRRESVEARAAVLGAVAGVLRPLRDNFNDVRNLKYVHETEEFHIGMPFGALMTCIGMYQLWNFAPNLCLDVAMPYAFYKLSIIAADVRRRGFSPDLIIRIKLALIVAMTMKDIHLKLTPLDTYVRLPVYFIYLLSVLWDFSGLTKFAKYGLPAAIYRVVSLFQKPKLVKRSQKSTCTCAEGDGELVPCVHQPKNSGDAKEGGQTLQFICEPNDSSSAKQDGEALQSVSAPDNHIHITVKQEGEALQSVSAPDNHIHITVKQEGDPLQVFVSENL